MRNDGELQLRFSECALKKLHISFSYLFVFLWIWFFIIFHKNYKQKVCVCVCFGFLCNANLWERVRKRNSEGKITARREIFMAIMTGFCFVQFCFTLYCFVFIEIEKWFYWNNCLSEIKSRVFAVRSFVLFVVFRNFFFIYFVFLSACLCILCSCRLLVWRLIDFEMCVYWWPEMIKNQPICKCSSTNSMYFVFNILKRD